MKLQACAVCGLVFDVADAEQRDEFKRHLASESDALGITMQEEVTLYLVNPQPELPF